MNLDSPLKSVLRTTALHIKKLDQTGIKTVRNLLEIFPRAIESTNEKSSFSEINLSEKNTLVGNLCDFRIEKTPRGKKLGRAALVLEDGSTIDVVWFVIPYTLKNFRDEKKVWLVGKVTRNYGIIQISNPEIHFEQNIHVGGLRAIYSESPPITSKWLREKIAGCLVFVKEFEEILPKEILKARNLLGKTEAVKLIHEPNNIEQWNAAKSRLAFEEIFEIQVRVLREKFLREQKARNPYFIKFDAEPVKEDLKKVPFELTTAQKKTLFAILKDFELDRSAHRLVQGDVGSGKTIVAFLAGNAHVRAGNQVTILSPTAILAQQHFANALKFFDPTVRCELLIGATTAKKKEKIKRDLASGQIDVLIGTHAILTEDTVFKNLGLAVIDEQHRFGVKQRAILGETGCHVVAMTATPIPRTLALTVYGDQDLSVIDELPPGRKEIITRVVGDDAMRRKMELFADDHIAKGRQVFWVCPLVDESDKIEARNVMTEYERITQVFHNRRVEFLHGKMKQRAKDSIMGRFKNKEFDILVSTSVIEVGVDIPNATVMMIENSERFGLAQLHQFRGRIGRNDMQSYCFLMVGKTEDKHKTRLQAMEKYHSGQKLAEIDLELRGMGELYGTKQAGMPDFKCADLSDLQMLQDARDWAIKILQEDVSLEKYPLLKKRVEEGEVFF
jgi:ATP-dependent DNA helicase RecG